MVPSSLLASIAPSAADARALSPAALERLGMHLARAGVIAALVLIGLTKFTAAEAAAIRPLVESSPLLSWSYAVASQQAVSNVIGVLELLAAALLLLRPLSPKLALVGALLAVGTFLTTLSFLVTLPGAWDTSHAVPRPGPGAQFILKDLALLGAAVWGVGDAWKKSRV